MLTLRVFYGWAWTIKGTARSVGQWWSVLAGGWCWWRVSVADERRSKANPP